MEVSGNLQEEYRDDVGREEEIIVRADEVDETGTNISAISPTNDGNFEARVEARREQDIKAIGSPKILANAVSSPPKPPLRPILRRDGSAPPPPRQPPPPAPPSQEDAPLMADSLSLAELRNMVKDFPKSEAAAYAYVYEDTRTFAEELEEWFQYSCEDNAFITRAKEAFETSSSAFEWGELATSPTMRYRWLALPPESREIFINHQLRSFNTANADQALQNMDCLAHIAMGVWHETSWLDDTPQENEQTDFDPPNDKYRRTVGQLRCIESSAESLSRMGAVQILFDVLTSICERDT